MKIVSYKSEDTSRGGLLIRDQVYDIQKGGKTIGVELPQSVLELLNLEESGMELLKTLDQQIKRGFDHWHTGKWYTHGNIPGLCTLSGRLVTGG